MDGKENNSAFWKHRAFLRKPDAVQLLLHKRPLYELQNSSLFASGAEQRFCPSNLLNKKGRDGGGSGGGKEKLLNSLYTNHTFFLISLISYHCF